MITFEEMKNKINEYGYYAEEELLYEAYNALLRSGANIIADFMRR